MCYDEVGSENLALRALVAPPSDLPWLGSSARESPRDANCRLLVESYHVGLYSVGEDDRAHRMHETVEGQSLNQGDAQASRTLKITK
mgnify:CR=1 FL=1